MKNQTKLIVKLFVFQLVSDERGPDEMVKFFESANKAYFLRRPSSIELHRANFESLTVYPHHKILKLPTIGFLSF